MNEQVRENEQHVPKPSLPVEVSQEVLELLTPAL